jgi:hypothetical protein
MGSIPKTAPFTPPKAAAVIFIQSVQPNPPGEVEVTPGGSIIFLNLDKCDYGLTLYKPGADSASGINILLPANGRATVLVRENDTFVYELYLTDGSRTGSGGGPIKN